MVAEEAEKPDGRELARWALAAAVVAHLAALAGTSFWLLPGLDLGANALVRASQVVRGVWTWRIGWVLWLVAGAATVVSSAALAQVLARGRRGRLWALGAEVLSLAALALDVDGVMTACGGLVVSAVRALHGRPAAAVDYLALETHALTLLGVCAASARGAIPLLWAIALARAGGGLSGKKALVAAGLAGCGLFWAGSAALGFATLLASVDLGYPCGEAAELLLGAGYLVLLGLAFRIRQML